MQINCRIQIVKVVHHFIKLVIDQYLRRIINHSYDLIKVKYLIHKDNLWQQIVAI